MEQLQSFIGQINSYAWGIPMLILILGTGLFLSVGLKIMTILRIPFAFRLLWQGRIPNDEAGEISPFNALMTSYQPQLAQGIWQVLPPLFSSAAQGLSSGCGSQQWLA